jgi:uncharacterized tellurite resistance protein B-like protein
MNIKAENLHEAIALLNQERTNVITTPFSEKVYPVVNAVMKDASEKRNAISVLVSMTYCSLSGNIKNRDILIRRIIASKGDYYIDGVALDIRAPRLIKVSAIQQIHDTTSGRVYTNPMEFIQKHLGVSLSGGTDKKHKDGFETLVERTGAEMTVLMYMVAIDGKRDKSERQKVFDYIKYRTTDLTYSDEQLVDYLVSLAPDEESFSLALAKVLSQEQSVVQAFIEIIMDIIMVDGHVDHRERAFLIRIMDLLEQDGYEIKIPI